MQIQYSLVASCLMYKAVHVASQTDRQYVSFSVSKQAHPIHVSNGIRPDTSSSGQGINLQATNIHNLSIIYISTSQY